MYSSADEPFRYSTRAVELYRHDHIVDIVEQLKPRNILEIGCSLGLLTRRLPGNVTPIDLSFNAVERLGHGATASVLDLPFKDASFDLVLASDGPKSWFLNDEELQIAYREIARVARKDILITEYLRPKAFEPFLSGLATQLRVVRVGYLYNRLWYSLERALPMLRGSRLLMRFVVGLSRVLGRRAAHHIIVVLQKPDQLADQS